MGLGSPEKHKQIIMEKVKPHSNKERLHQKFVYDNTVTFQWRDYSPTRSDKSWFTRRRKE